MESKSSDKKEQKTILTDDAVYDLLSESKLKTFTENTTKYFCEDNICQTIILNTTDTKNGIHLTVLYDDIGNDTLEPVDIDIDTISLGLGIVDMYPDWIDKSFPLFNKLRYEWKQKNISPLDFFSKDPQRSKRFQEYRNELAAIFSRVEQDSYFSQVKTLAKIADPLTPGAIPCESIQQAAGSNIIVLTQTDSVWNDVKPEDEPRLKIGFEGILHKSCVAAMNYLLTPWTGIRIIGYEYITTEGDTKVDGAAYYYVPAVGDPAVGDPAAGVPAVEAFRLQTGDTTVDNICKALNYISNLKNYCFKLFSEKNQLCYCETIWKI